MKNFLTLALALTSTIDPKVKIIKVEPTVPNQWPSLQLNSYCYEAGLGSAVVNRRTMGTLEIMGKLAALANEHKVDAGLMFQTYTKNSEGKITPRLAVGIRPESVESAAEAASAQNSKFKDLCKQAVQAGFNLKDLPANTIAAEVTLEAYLATKNAVTSSKAKPAEPEVEGPPASEDEIGM